MTGPNLNWGSSTVTPSNYRLIITLGIESYLWPKLNLLERISFLP